MAHSKFTPEIRGALLERFAAGCSLPDAASACGINDQTLKGWLKRGRQSESGELAEFARAADEARRDADARPEPMDQDELARVVSQAARKGNTQAMKLRWEMLRVGRNAEDDDAEQEDPLGLDELAPRRAARG